MVQGRWGAEHHQAGVRGKLNSGPDCSLFEKVEAANFGGFFMEMNNTTIHFFFCDASYSSPGFYASRMYSFSIFTLKWISAFNALNTFKIVSTVALFALLSSLEI